MVKLATRHENTKKNENVFLKIREDTQDEGKNMSLWVLQVWPCYKWFINSISTGGSQLKDDKSWSRTKGYYLEIYAI